MDDQMLYEEKISSPWTKALFIGLMILFGILAIWRYVAGGWNALGIVFTILALFFLFYVINYRTLEIRLTPQALNLKFGLFSYRIPIENIETCHLDDPPWFLKYGGAGIHFYMTGGRYRASFNFLEYPRVLVALRKKAGLVRDVSFTTRDPDQLVSLISSQLSHTFSTASSHS